MCSLFVQTVDSVNLLSRAVEATRHVGTRLLDDKARDEFEPFEDLRTRLQLSVFFMDAERVKPEHCGTAARLLHSLLQRLDEPDFKNRVGGRGDVNYYDLVGYGLTLTEIVPFLHSLYQLQTDKAELGRLNTWIDDLRRKIGFVNSTIQIAGSMEDFDVRYEAKTCWQALDYRISHLFPRRGGKGIFHDEATEQELEGERRQTEKQKSFMEGYLQKVRAGNAG